MESQRKTDLLNRLKSIQGHVRGVQRMVEEDQYCIDILRQTLAVQKAIDRLNAIVLENHLQTCVARALRGDDPEERERVLAELLQLYEGGASVGLNRHVESAPAEACSGEVASEGDTGARSPAGNSASSHCGPDTSLAGGSEG